LSSRTDGYAPDSGRMEFEADSSPTFSEEAVCKYAFRRSDARDLVLRQVATFLLDTYDAFLQNNSSFPSKEDRNTKPPFMSALDTSGDHLPPIFAQLPDSVFEELDMTKPPRTVTVDIREGASSLVVHPHTKKGRAASAREELARIADMVPVKEEAEDVIEPAATAELGPDAKQAYEVLKEGLKRYGSVHVTDLDGLIEVHGDATGEELKEKVDLLLTDPPYNFRREAQAANSAHDTLTEAEAGEIIHLAYDLLVPGGQAHVFCSIKQFVEFSRWVYSYRVDESSGESRDEESSENDEGEEQGGEEGQGGRQGGGGLQATRKTKTMKKKKKPEDTRAFNVERVPLHYTRARGNYKSDPRIRKVTHTSFQEHALHFWKKGPSAADILRRVNYNAPQYTPSSLPGWTNVMDNIPRLPVNEVVYSTVRSDNGRRRMVRPEQKNVSWMMDIIQQYTTEGMLVLDLCCGTMSVAKACLMFNKHRRFVVSDIDEACIRDSYPSLLLVFARQLVNGESDITGSTEELEAARTYIKAMEEKEARVDMEEACGPNGFPAMQRLPNYLLTFLSNYHQEYKLVGTLRTVPPTLWPGNMQSLFYGVDPQMLLAHECSKMGVQVRPSEIKSEHAGLGLFAARPFGAEEIVGYYYGSLLYLDLLHSRNRRKVVGKGFMKVNESIFAKWALEITDPGGMMVNNKKMSVWIVPGPMCAVRYINDPRYLPSDRTPKSKRSRAPNVEFFREDNTFSANQVALHTVQCVKTLRNIAVGEEFYLDYGSDYNMPE